MKIRAMIMVILVVIAITGCARPAVLIGRGYVGENEEKIRKLIINKNENSYFSYYYRVCDLGENDREQNCKDSLVLDDVY